MNIIEYLRLTYARCDGQIAQLVEIRDAIGELIAKADRDPGQPAAIFAAPTPPPETIRPSTSAKSWQCEVHGLTFTSAQGLGAHRRHHHANGEPMTTSTGPEPADDDDELGPFDCPTPACKLSFATRKALERHQTFAHRPPSPERPAPPIKPGQVWRCITCLDEFTDWALFGQHTNDRHGRRPTPGEGYARRKA